MNKITVEEAYRFLTGAYEANLKIAFCMLSQPGIGKTSIVKKIAKEHGHKVVTVLCSQCDPSEIAGATWKSDNGEYLVDFDPAWSNELKDGDILFFDEFCTAPEHVQNAVLTMILDRKYKSGRKLPNVMIIAAANPTATAMAIPVAVRGRFVWFDVKQDFSNWSKYMEEKYPDWWNEIIATRFKTVIDSSSYKCWNPVTYRRAEEIFYMMIEAKSQESSYLKDNLIDILSSADSAASSIGKFLNDIFQMLEKKESIANKISSNEDKILDGIILAYETITSDGNYINTFVDSNYSISEIINAIKDSLSEEQWDEFCKLLRKSELEV